MLLASLAQLLFRFSLKCIGKQQSIPINGDEQLARRVVEHIGGTFNGIKFNGLGMSTNVILARLESRLFTVEGLEDKAWNCQLMVRLTKSKYNNCVPRSS